MGTTLRSENGIDEGDLPKLPSRKRHDELPSVIVYFLVPNFGNGGFGVKEHVDVLVKRIADGYLFSVQTHSDSWKDSGHVIGSFAQKIDSVLFEACHLESWKIRVKGHFREVSLLKRRYFCFLLYCHVALPDHLEHFLVRLVTALDYELL